MSDSLSIRIYVVKDICLFLYLLKQYPKNEHKLWKLLFFFFLNEIDSISVVNIFLVIPHCCSNSRVKISSMNENIYGNRRSNYITCDHER